jgi:isopenicillin-N epimerase
MHLTLAANWPLDPSVIYLNHGSFGACPSAVLAAQAALRLEMEREPVDFLSSSLQGRLDAARGILAAFVGADPLDLAFVPNATAGVNAVLRSLELARGDEILVTTHTYNACRRAVEYVSSRNGLRVVTAVLPFPCPGEDAIVAAILGALSARTRLALIDHVASPTALILPIRRLVDELARRGVDTLVDGAHAPGMIPMDLAGIGAAYYTGNAHKWLCAPKGAAFLWVRRDRQSRLHPPVISHGYEAGFQAEFDWTGTADPTAYLCIPEAIRFVAGLLPGGWPEVMAANHSLALEARGLALRTLGGELPCPDQMVGSMASIPLPKPRPGSPAEHMDCKALHDWLRERGIEAWLHPHPVPLVRLSAQLYNTPDQYRQLLHLLGRALHGT